MINKADRKNHFYQLGKNEGRHDWLFINDWTTVEDRAYRAFISMGFTVYKDQFIKGYIEASKQ